MTDPAMGEAGELLDAFLDLSGWSTIASGRAQLAITQADGPHGKAMRLDFDFHGGGGFVVARKKFQRAMPPSWAFRMQVRGAAPANKLEFKLADPSGRNVWWFHRDAFEFPAAWQTLRIRSREVEFAWGPAGGGAMSELGVIEVAITAGPGGKGSIWLADLRFEDLEPKAPPERARVERAAGTRSGVGPRRLAADELAQRSAAPLRSGSRSISRPSASMADSSSTGSQRGGARAFEVQRSDDGFAWTTLWTAQQAEGERSYV